MHDGRVIIRYGVGECTLFAKVMMCPIWDVVPVDVHIGVSVWSGLLVVKP